MKKVLIIGPIGDIGGRELETGFIAKTLSSVASVKILSTGNMTHNSQIFNFVSDKQIINLKKHLYNSNLFFKVLAILSSLKSKIK
ncbi:hypothetical protein [Formosa haliotis]|uniref:hypothetical protein n=1 Tax=Formosa haliotis TaxID=1555194 RepID=UPI000824F806|nr:hypothetical protein [Formosa haliotis]